MTGTRREMVRRDATRRGWKAVGYGAGTLVVSSALLGLGWSLFGTLALLGGGGLTALKTWEWLKFRGENGLRF